MCRLTLAVTPTPELIVHRSLIGDRAHRMGSRVIVRTSALHTVCAFSVGSLFQLYQQNTAQDANMHTSEAHGGCGPGI